MNNETNREKFEEILSKKNRKKALKLYLIPIITGIVFILIMLTIVIPKIFEITTNIEEINKKNEEIAKEGLVLNQLKELNNRSNEILFQLEQVNSIASSERTEVVAFRDKITSLMTQSSLTINSQQLSETDLENVQEGAKGAITLVEVPFEFEVSGLYQNIIAFIDKLSALDDFTIVNRMELSQTTGINAAWVMKITLVKYQFNNTSDLQEVFTNVPPTAKIPEEILEYIRSRGNQTEEN